MQFSEERAFMKDWYQIYKSCSISRSSTHPVLCLDMGKINLLHKNKI